MGKQKKTLVERTYGANVFTDAALSRIESLDGTNLMPQNTDFEQLKSLSGPGEDTDLPDQENKKEST